LELLDTDFLVLRIYGHLRTGLPVPRKLCSIIHASYTGVNSKKVPVPWARLIVLGLVQRQ